MITKEEFLYNTTEEEIFSLLHEFKERFNKLRKDDFNFFCCTFELEATDRDLNVLGEQMITDIKGSVWL